MKTYFFTRSALPVALRLAPCTLISILALVIAQPTTAAMSNLGTLAGAPGKVVQTQAVSGDGSTVVGQAGNNWDNQMFRWSVAQGFSNLGPVFSRPFTRANSVSRNGRIVVGDAPTSAEDLKPGTEEWNLQAYRWDSSLGFSFLGTFGGPASGAYGVSSDGTAVAGYAVNASGKSRAFRWTRASGMLDLGSLPGLDSSFAFGISGDGKVVVGFSGTMMFNSKPFRWDVASSTMTQIPCFSSYWGGEARATNQDGSVVVGQCGRSLSGGAVRETAFRWTAAGGLQNITHLDANDDRRSTAYAVNADGSVVVGQLGDEAFRWVNNSVTTLGKLPGTDYSRATGVSENGNVVVGVSGDSAFIWTPGVKTAQSLSNLQNSLTRSVASVIQRVRGNNSLPHRAPLVAVRPANAGKIATLDCATQLTSSCTTAPTPDARPLPYLNSVASVNK